MPSIMIKGFPPEDHHPKQLRFLRLYIRRAGITDFWINDIFSSGGSELKEAEVEITSNKDAFLLEKFLKEVPYIRHSIAYFLRWQRVQHGSGDRPRGGSSLHPFMGDHPFQGNFNSRNCENSFKRQIPHSQLFSDMSNRYSSNGESSFERPIPRNPLFSDTSKLDVEIEILRKKRQLIEEEQKLLAEQEKLQRMKEYGYKAPRREFGASSFTFGMPERPWEHPPVRDNRSKTMFVPPQRLEGLPLFTFPCKYLMRSIRPVIHKKTNVEHERSLSEKLIRSHLRKTLAMALENVKKYLSAMEIVKLYRRRHPETEDEALVMRTLKDIRTSFWPIQKNRPSKKTLPEKNKEDTTGTTTATDDVNKDSKAEGNANTNNNDAESKVDDGIMDTEWENSKEDEDNAIDVDANQTDAATASTNADAETIDASETKANDAVDVFTNASDGNKEEGKPTDVDGNQIDS